MIARSQEMGSELDSILRQREGEMEGPEAAEPVTADTDNILSSMKAFVSEVSGYKGVDDIAGMKFHSSSDEEDSDDDVPTVPQPSIRSSSARVVIDPDRFLQVLSGKYGSAVGASRPAMSTPVFNSGKQVASAPLYGPTLSTTFGDDNLSDMMDSSGEECDNEEDVEEPTVVDYMVTQATIQ